jgi:hypothetical protein
MSLMCKMDIDTTSIPDEKMDDGYQRYLRLHAVVQDIKSGTLSRTTDWYAEQNHLLQSYDDNFNGFENVHPEFQEPEFRQKCKILDILIKKLMKECNTYRWFSLYDYLKFNETLIWVVDYVVANDEAEELGDMLANMKF